MYCNARVTQGLAAVCSSRQGTLTSHHPETRAISLSSELFFEERGYVLDDGEDKIIVNSNEWVVKSITFGCCQYAGIDGVGARRDFHVAAAQARFLYPEQWPATIDERHMRVVVVVVVGSS
jgi:hypothetical protein